MNDEILNVLLTTTASIVLTSYLPKALMGLWESISILWKYIVFPVGRFVSFPFIRFYRDRYKKYEIKIMKFYTIDSLRKEFFFDWYRWTRWGGRCPMSHREERRFLEYQEKLKIHEEKMKRMWK